MIGTVTAGLFREVLQHPLHGVLFAELTVWSLQHVFFQMIVDVR